MKRSRLLILAVAATVATSAAPRRAVAASGGSVRYVHRYGSAPVPGRCADHRAARRWASFSAADFPIRDYGTEPSAADWRGVREP